MTKNEMIETLQLILSRSSAAQEEAMNALKAIRVKSPMVDQRYGRVLGIALSDQEASWTAEESVLLGRFWTESTGENGDETLILRTLRLSGADWKRARGIGNGDATAGIRAALREYPKPN